MKGKVHVYAGHGSPPLHEFKSNKHTHNTPDASTKRGAGPLFRKRGGKVPPQFEEEREKEEEEGREGKKRGGEIHGMAKKHHAGRPGRKHGGKTGATADLHPQTHEDDKGPEDLCLMPHSERTP